MQDSLPRTPFSTESGVRQFRFWQDPLCMGAWALYAFNRFVLIPHFSHQYPILREHLGDSLLIPAALPPLMWIREKCGLRHATGAPNWREVMLWTLLSALFFEGIGPRLLHRSVGDWGDVMAYVIGALISGLWWNKGGVSFAPKSEN